MKESNCVCGRFRELLQVWSTRRAMSGRDEKRYEVDATSAEGKSRWPVQGWCKGRPAEKPSEELESELKLSTPSRWPQGW